MPADSRVPTPERRCALASADQIAGQLRGLVARSKKDCMQRVVLLVEAQARREAPVRKGTLRRSITSRVERGGDRGIVGTNLVYARRVHEGSGEVIIVPKRKKALFWKGARHPVKMVKQKPRRGNPFFRRAVDANRSRIERELQGWGNAVWAKVG